MKILLLSHSATRTGAPILLFNIGRLLKEAYNHEFIILVKDEGPMISDFSTLGKVIIWENYKSNFKNSNILKRLINKFYFQRIQQRKRDNVIKELQSVDYIINNTITNGELLEILANGFSGRIISYIHELKYSTLKFASFKDVEMTVKLSHGFITPCDAVKLYLQDEFKIPESKVNVVNSYIPDDTGVLHVKKYDNIKNILTIGCSGTSDLRKGFDVFILLVKYIHSLEYQNHFKFIWKGVDTTSELYLQGINDIEKAGLKDMVTLSVVDNQMRPFYESIDLFLLLSREDPYPLVVLEAANYCKPTICFADAGGAPEFVSNDAGSIIEYMNIKQVANELVYYFKNQDILFHKGEIAARKVKKMHQDKSIVLNQLNDFVFV